jgi:hypothetical protein
MYTAAGLLTLAFVANMALRPVSPHLFKTAAPAAAAKL